MKPKALAKVKPAAVKTGLTRLFLRSRDPENLLVSAADSYKLHKLEPRGNSGGMARSEQPPIGHGQLPPALSSAAPGLCNPPVNNGLICILPACASHPAQVVKNSSTSCEKQLKVFG